MKELSTDTTQKLERLAHWFANKGGSLVAFSGGIDSTLVLYLARLYQGKDRAIGVISNSESLKQRDFNLAKQFCADFDIQLKVIKTNELLDVRYNQNPIDRCFFCKDHLFEDLELMVDQYPGFSILSGTNRDDLGDYRPGIEAAKRHQVLAPLAECQITKDEIRELALYFGLPQWNKPASPCLSSRIPYHQEVTVDKLRAIEKAEDFLNSLGFEDVRVRHYGHEAKVEFQPADLLKAISMEDKIINGIKNVGFEVVGIDPEGLVSGKMNRAIPQE